MAMGPRTDSVGLFKYLFKYVLIETDVESRTGALYCQMCDDFIWDPTLEDLRTRKYGTGTFSSKCKFCHVRSARKELIFQISQETKAR